MPALRDGGDPCGPMHGDPAMAVARHTSVAGVDSDAHLDDDAAGPRMSAQGPLGLDCATDGFLSTGKREKESVTGSVDSCSPAPRSVVRTSR